MAKEQKKKNDPAPKASPETAEEQAQAVEETAEETPAPAPSEEEALREQLSQANDKFLRLAAEYDNFRKRTAREKEELNALCKSTVAKELLPVIDNVERALSHDAESLDEYRKGVEMIGKQFAEVLQKLGIESFGTEGDAFDPNLHNAVMHIEREDLSENVISAVFGKGYRLGDKVIRPAMVQVAN